MILSSHFNVQSLLRSRPFASDELAMFLAALSVAPSALLSLAVLRIKINRKLAKAIKRLVKLERRVEQKTS